METQDFVFDGEMRTFFHLNRFTSSDSDRPYDYFTCENFDRHSRAMNPTTEDLKVIHNLSRLDQLAIKSADPERYDELLWDVQQGIMKRLDIWLAQNGFEGNRSLIVSFSEAYLSFVYGVGREAPITLKNVSSELLSEFMVRFLTRNTSMSAGEVAACPSAMRLMYLFLLEKGYLTDSVRIIIESISNLEPCFLYLLGDRYGEP